MLDTFLVAGMPEEILFAVRKPSMDGHWYGNIAYYATDPCRATFPMNSGGRLCIYNVRTKETRVLFDDPKGNIRDPQIHYDAGKLVFAYLPKPINYSGAMSEMSAGGTFSVERLLGSVPVSKDGSAYFRLPPLRSFLFLATDGKGHCVILPYSEHSKSDFEPYQIGTGSSRLLTLIEEGHEGVKMPAGGDISSKRTTGSA